MVKKDSNTCETCKCGSCCGWKCFAMLLTALWCIAAIVACVFACKASQTAKDVYNLNVLSAWWEENFKKMNELYASKAYIDYATEQTSGYISSFLAAYGDTDDENSEIYDEDITNDENADTNNVSTDDVKNIVEDMLASTPIRGDKDARFTIIEYTELHCPYCQLHSQNWTINSVIEQFPGEVNSISRHFIIHGEDALNLASAMECIAELKSEVYHEAFDKAFEAYPVDMEWLTNIASELGVDKAALQSCIDEWKYRQSISDGMTQASQLFGVNGTPGNVIIDRETGKFELVSGAQPADSFVTAINRMKNA